MNWCGKVIQKRLLILLSDRTTFLAVLGSGLLLIISFISFGEAWIQWSGDKYAAIFNSFSDNLAGRSLQNQLCQHVPIDVVYTWVNGSDPLFLDGLKHAKEKLKISEDDSRNKHPPEFEICPYENCIPSHYFTTNSLPKNVKSELIRSQNSFLSKELIDVKDQNLICTIGRHEGDEVGKSNRTFLIMDSIEAAIKVRNTNQTRIGVGIENFQIHQAFWTSEWTIPLSYPIPGHVLFTKLPSSVTQEKLLHILPKHLSEKVGRIYLYNQIAVVEILDTNIVNEFLNEHVSIPLENGATILVSQAYLILRLSDYMDSDAFSKNRFSDREELRYSLRSVEKYAPWVRHIYLVTNGQIPHWLNLDHPRLTVVTHEDIFENQSNLPTFSSPAIESQLFRIPGLSQKFLYFNDDVFLGEEVWPTDFFDNTLGQKVYFSWPLPDCAPGCPNNWIKDGYCDTVCNTTECMFDGGDCLGDPNNIKMGFGGDNSVNFHWMNDSAELQEKPYCAENCLDLWLSDSFCDTSCNVAECGYDVGDCGYSKFINLYQSPTIDTKELSGNWSVELPKGTTSVYWDFSKMFESLVDVALVPVQHKSVRALSLSKQHHFLTMVLHYNTTVVLNITLQGRTKKDAKIAMFYISIKCDTHDHIPYIETDDGEDQHFDLSDDSNPDDHNIPEEENIISVPLPDSIDKIRGRDLLPSELLSNVDAKKLNLTKDDDYNLGIIEDQLRADELTLKGFNIKKTAILQPYVRRYVMRGGRLETLNLVQENRIHSNLTHHTIGDEKSKNNDTKRDDSIVTNNAESKQSVLARKLMDAYGDSMLHVHALFSKHYGITNRLAISHMPHMIDKEIFSSLKNKFEKEWSSTSSHQLRQHNDMQFAFSYFHYLISEKEEFDIHKVFHQYDTDQSGTWSDREIRTLLTRIHNLPLALEHINTFERAVIECATNLTKHGFVLPNTKTNTHSHMYERYYDSKLPLVSSFLITNCQPLIRFLRNSLRNEPKYKHKVIEKPDNLISFKRITSNITQVVSVLDDLRKNPKKFLCLNDNTDSDTNEETANKMVHAVLVDYLESVLPVPSSFELPLDYRNKFLHTSELARWQIYRSALTIITYSCILFLIIVSIAGYYKIDIDAKMISWGKYTVTIMKTIWDPNQEYVIVRNPRDYNTV